MKKKLVEDMLKRLVQSSDTLSKEIMKPQEDGGIQSLHSEISNLQEQLENSQSHILQFGEESGASKKLTSVSENNQKFAQKITELQSENRDFKSALQVADMENQRLKSETTSLRRDMETADTERRLYEDQQEKRCDNYKLKIVALEEEIENMQKFIVNEDSVSKEHEKILLQKKVDDLVSRNELLQKQLKIAQSQSRSTSPGQAMLQNWRSFEEKQAMLDKTEKRIAELQKENLSLELKNQRLMKNNVIAQANLRAEVTRKTKDVEKLQTKLKEVEKQSLISFEGETRELKDKLSALDGKLENLEMENESLLKQIDECTTREKKSRADEVGYINKISELKSTLAEYEGNTGKINAEKHQEVSSKELTEEVKQLEDELQNKVEKIQWLEAEISQLNIRSQVEQKDLHDKKNSTIESLETDLEKKNLEIQSLKEEIDRLSVDYAKLEVELNDVRSVNNECGDESNGNVETMKRENEDLRERVKILEEDCKLIDQLEAELAEKDELLKKDDVAYELSLEVESLKAALEKREVLIEKTQASLMKFKANGGEEQTLKKEIDEMKTNLRKSEQQFQSEMDIIVEESNKEIADLREKLERTEADLENLRVMKDNENQKEIDGLNAKLADRVTTISALVKASVTLEGKLSTLESEKEKLRTEKESLETEMMQLKKRESDDLEKLTANEESSSRRLEEARETIEELQKELDQSKVATAKAVKELTIAKSKSSEEKDFSGNKHINLKSFSNCSREQQKKIKSLMAEIYYYKNKSNSDEIRRLQEESEIFAQQVIEQEQEINDLRDSLEKMCVENEELRKVDMVTSLSSNGESTKAFDQMTSLTQSQAEELNKLQLKLKHMENEKSDLAHENQIKLIELESQIEVLTKEKESKQSIQEKIISNMKEEYESELKESQDIISSLERKIINLTGQNQTLTSSLTEKKRTMEDERGKYIEVLDKIEVERDTNAIQSQQITDLNIQISNLKEQISSNTFDRDNEMLSLKAKLSKLEKKNKGLLVQQESVEDLRKSVEAKERSNGALEREVIHLRESVSDLELKLKESASGAEDISRLKADIQYERNLNKSLEQEIAYLEEMTKNTTSKEKEIDRLKRSIEMEVSTNKKYMAEISSLNQRLDFMKKKNRTRLIEEDDDPDDCVEMDRIMNKKLSKEVQQYKSRVLELERMLENKTHERNSTLEEELLAVQNQLKISEKTTVDTEKDNSQLRMELSLSEKRVKKLEKKLEHSHLDIDNASEKLSEAQNRVQKLEKRLEHYFENDNDTGKLKEDLATAENRARKLEKKLEQSYLEADHLSEKLSEAKNRIQKLEKRLEHYFESDNDNSKLKEDLTTAENRVKKLEQKLEQSYLEVDHTKTRMAEKLSESQKLVKKLEKRLSMAQDPELNPLDETFGVAHKQLVEDLENERKENSLLVRELKQREDRISDLEEGARKILELQANMQAQPLDQKTKDEFDHMLMDIRLEKEQEVNELQKQLSEQKLIQADMESEMKSYIKDLESACNDLKNERDMQLRKKADKITMLESYLKSRDDTINDMKSEMDQLQNSMEQTSMRKRDENDELNQELMDSQAKINKKEREISSLKMKLEEKMLKHKDEVGKLKDKITALEAESPFQRSIQVQHDDQRVEELKKTVQQLQWRNSTLTQDCEVLQDKLNSYEANKSSKNDKWRNTQLKEQNKILQKRIKELEKGAENLNSEA